MYGRVSQLDEDIENDMADIDVDDDANTVSNNRSDCDIDFIVFGLLLWLNMRPMMIVVYLYDDNFSSEKDMISCNGKRSIAMDAQRLPTTINLSRRSM